MAVTSEINFLLVLKKLMCCTEVRILQTNVVIFERVEGVVIVKKRKTLTTLYNLQLKAILETHSSGTWS